MRSSSLGRNNKRNVRILIARIVSSRKRRIFLIMGSRDIRAVRQRKTYMEVAGFLKLFLQTSPRE